MEEVQALLPYIKRNKPYFVMIFLQFITAGMSLLSKADITQGMNPFVFVVYRQAFATLALAPFAFFLERGENSPPLSFVLLCKMALFSSWNALSLNLFHLALNYVTATFATALVNTIPAITFILAVCFRMESLSIKQIHGMAKVIGSALGLSGALICTFARGPAIYTGSDSRKDILRQVEQHYTNREWIKGSLIILACNTAWCLWFIMQGPLLKQYPAKLRLTALQCLFSCVLSAIWAAAKERGAEYWKLGWNLNLVSVFYCGVISTAISYSLLVWVVEKKGPVFGAVFGPLALVITAVLSAVFLQETLHWGSVSGAIFAGYWSLWHLMGEEPRNERKRRESADKRRNRV